MQVICTSWQLRGVNAAENKLSCSCTASVGCRRARTHRSLLNPNWLAHTLPYLDSLVLERQVRTGQMGCRRRPAAAEPRAWAPSAGSLKPWC